MGKNQNIGLGNNNDVTIAGRIETLIHPSTLGNGHAERRFCQFLQDAGAEGHFSGADAESSAAA
jgi:hypothetical protein